MWWAILPGTWVRHANKLRRSAEVLWEPLALALTLKAPFSQSDLALWDNIYAFLLVAGASLEAMFKATAMQAQINKNGSLGAILTDDRRLQRWIRTHDLLKLAERASISLSDSERAQLERFTKYVVWAGSYPVPLDLRDRRPNAVSLVDFDVSDADRVWFVRLYARAEERYQEHVQSSRNRQESNDANN
jgi:hypothetical protein